MTMNKFEPYRIEYNPQGAEMCGDVKAGFPSPAEDSPRERLDLLRLIIRHPASTFYFRVSGVSMTDAGLDEGDIIVVDRSLDADDGRIAVCFLDGEFTVKRIRRENGNIRLMPANDRYDPIEITAESDFDIWGVVTYVIKKV